jgi:hypothetical protein
VVLTKIGSPGAVATLETVIARHPAKIGKDRQPHPLSAMLRIDRL